jgi:hypothetical protein
VPLLAGDNPEPPIPSEYATLTGGYLEVRAVDVDLGRLLRVPEIAAVGEVAILGWKIHEGRWAGQDLSGLQVAAAVCSRRQPLDEALERDGVINSVVFVDATASPDQARALVSLIEKLTERKLGRVVDVRKTSLVLELTAGGAERVSDLSDDEATGDSSGDQSGVAVLEIPGVLRVCAAVEAEDDAACGAVCGGHGQSSSEELHSSLSETERRFHALTREYSLLGSSRGSGAAGGVSSKAAVVGVFSL